ncbi:MAG: phytanoyl-CoA dioxygenase family protein [Alphaproteobacteria bacterium]
MDNSKTTSDLAQTYERDGYVVLRNVFSTEEIKALRDEATAICAGRKGDILGSDLICEGTISDDDLMQRVLAIHFPHKISTLIRETQTKLEVVNFLNTIIGPDIKCMQSMLFAKNSGKPGQAWHQDEFFIPTRDMSLAGVWIALDDARTDNGGLWVHPGSHKHKTLWPMKSHGDARFDNSQEAYDFPYEREGGIPLDADAGDVVIFHGYLLHRSLNNTRTEGYRRALVNHVMSATSMLPWNIGIAPCAPDDFRDFEMVSGKDPYVWKGKEHLTRPFLRPEDPAQAKKILAKLLDTQTGDPE